MWWFGRETNGGGGGGGLWVLSLLLLYLASKLCTWVFMYQTISGAFLKGNQLSPLCYRQCISIWNRVLT